MPVTVICGGQFGSEGKGKVAYNFAKRRNATIAVRVGGPNSGHTVETRAKKVILRQLPAASMIPNIFSVIGPGSYIDLAELFVDIKLVGLDIKDLHKRLMIDENAVILGPDDTSYENSKNLRQRIGSTLSGTGSGVIKRIKRNDHNVRFAKDCSKLNDLHVVDNTSKFFHNSLLSFERILVEGTQGFGLSLTHSPYYPFVTSRDTTAASFLSEAGLSPIDVDEIVLVIRSFPIRVPGNSGPLKNEIDWLDVTKFAGFKMPIIERTSVTNKIRRIAKFDPEIVKHAILVNRPNYIIMNHLDYIDSDCYYFKEITPRAYNFIRNVEQQIGSHIHMAGFGPGVDDLRHV